MTGLPVEESVRMTEDVDELLKYVHGVWPTLGSTTAKEQNTTGPAGSLVDSGQDPSLKLDWANFQQPRSTAYAM